MNIQTACLGVEITAQEKCDGGGATDSNAMSEKKERPTPLWSRSAGVLKKGTK